MRAKPREWRTKTITLLFVLNSSIQEGATEMSPLCHLC